MSHYALAVFADRPEDMDTLLDPYDENNKDEFVFEPVDDEEILREWAKFHEQNPAWKYGDWLLQMYTLRDGRYGHWYNPHGYYDYYTHGGRDYLFEIRPEVLKRCEEDGNWPEFFRKSDYEWFANDDPDDREEELRKEWREYIENGDWFHSAKFYAQRFGTEDHYVEEMLRPTMPYAFVTPDGEWHAPGRVGWFGVSDDTYESQTAYYNAWRKFITEAPDCYVSLVDCHI